MAVAPRFLAGSMQTLSSPKPMSGSTPAGAGRSGFQSQQHYRRWLRQSLLASAGLMSGIAALNLVVDPFDIYGLVRLPGINDQKSIAQLRLTKTQRLLTLKPQRIILGSSRALLGLNPDTPLLQDQLTYNAALEATSIREMRRMAEHALVGGQGRLQSLLVGLDFFTFNARVPAHPTFQEPRLYRPDRSSFENRFAYLGTRLKDLLSFDQSLATLQVLSQSLLKRPQQEVLQDSGWLAMPSNFSQRILATGGFRLPFLRETNAFLNGGYKDFDYRDAKGKVDALDEYRQLLDLAYRNHLETQLMVSPMHTWLCEGLDAVGLWPRFQQWKTALLQINIETAQRYGRSPFPLRDFSCYNAYTNEPVPPLGDTKTPMRWYWDASHYQAALGDRLLRRLLNPQNQSINSGFGILLTPQNLQQHLARQNQLKQTYRQKNLDDFKVISGIWKGR
jgi:hypothetical protein